MKKEIKNKVSTDVESSNSTVESIKSDVKTIASKYNYNANVKIVSQFGTDQVTHDCNSKWYINGSNT